MSANPFHRRDPSGANGRRGARMHRQPSGTVLLPRPYHCRRPHLQQRDIWEKLPSTVSTPINASIDSRDQPAADASRTPSDSRGCSWRPRCYTEPHESSSRDRRVDMRRDTGNPTPSTCRHSFCEASAWRAIRGYKLYTATEYPTQLQLARQYHHDHSTLPSNNILAAFDIPSRRPDYLCSLPALSSVPYIPSTNSKL